MPGDEPGLRRSDPAAGPRRARLGAFPLASETCPLCRAERISRWYFQSELCWIADCQICSTPMVVWRQHGMPGEVDRAAMLEELGSVAAREYPKGFWLDPVMRQIPDHFHCHARPKDGFFGPRKEISAP